MILFDRKSVKEGPKIGYRQPCSAVSWLGALRTVEDTSSALGRLVGLHGDCIFFLCWALRLIFGLALSLLAAFGNPPGNLPFVFLGLPVPSELVVRDGFKNRALRFEFNSKSEFPIRV